MQTSHGAQDASRPAVLRAATTPRPFYPAARWPALSWATDGARLSRTRHDHFLAGDFIVHHALRGAAVCVRLPSRMALRQRIVPDRGDSALHSSSNASQDAGGLICCARNFIAPSKRIVLLDPVPTRMPGSGLVEAAYQVRDIDVKIFSALTGQLGSVGA